MKFEICAIDNSLSTNGVVSWRFYILEDFFRTIFSLFLISRTLQLHYGFSKILNDSVFPLKNYDRNVLFLWIRIKEVIFEADSPLNYQSVLPMWIYLDKRVSKFTIMLQSLKAKRFLLSSSLFSPRGLSLGRKNYTTMIGS